MAIITDYDTLVTAIQDTIDRSDLATHVPNWIEAIENKLYRSLEIRGLENTFAIAAAPSFALSSLAGATFRNFKTIWVSSSTPTSVVEPMTLEQLFREYPNRTVTAARPRNYARHGSDTILLGPAGAAGVQISGVFYELLPHLNTTSPTTNWFTDNIPELLQYGALQYAAPFMANDPRLATWATMYADFFKTLTAFEVREKRGGATMAIRVA